MTREGWTFNGHHYTHCLSVRMGRPIETFHYDGKRLSEREWRLVMAADRATERARVNAEAATTTKPRIEKKQHEEDKAR